MMSDCGRLIGAHLNIRSLATYFSEFKDCVEESGVDIIDLNVIWLNEEGLHTEQMDSASMMLGATCFVIIAVFGFFKMTDVLHLGEKLNDQTYGVLQNFDRTCEQLNKFSTLVYYGMKCTLLMHILFCYFSHSYCMGRVIRGDRGYVCGAVVPLWYPIEINMEILRFIICSTLGYFLVHYVPLISLFPVMIWGCVRITVLRIRHLRELLSEISDISRLGDTKQKLNRCIKYHSATIQLVSDLNGCIGVICFPMYIIIPVLLALFGYQVIENRDLASCWNLLGWSSVLTACCMLGQILETESSLLAYTAYELRWYEMDPKLQKTFHIFLTRVQRPLQCKTVSSQVFNNALLLQVYKSFYTFLNYMMRIDE
ncbi:hypothetical protein HHI36_002128 [Cryptolaemus montrouzieri]|uniref:Odorant receptor n=1 Tax=Cryptolaemus montrouzieri TaxID=559131 RepID=A0ABD2PAF5_9CUCU